VFGWVFSVCFLGFVFCLVVAFWSVCVGFGVFYRCFVGDLMGI